MNLLLCMSFCIFQVYLKITGLKEKSFLYLFYWIIKTIDYSAFSHAIRQDRAFASFESLQPIQWEKKERRFFQYLLKSIIPNLIEIYHSVFQFLKYLFIPNSNHFLLIPLPVKTVHTQPVVFWLWVGGRLLTFYTLTLSDCKINYEWNSQGSTFWRSASSWEVLSLQLHFWNVRNLPAHLA